MNEYTPAVKRGIKWLDENVPDWRKDIDKKTLRQSHCDSCVLGQLSQSYEIALEEFDIDDSLAIKLGFNIPHENDIDTMYDIDTILWEFDLLTEAWKELL